MATLREALKASSGDYNIKIGTKSGSGFLWCGHVAEVADDLSEAENFVRDMYKARLKKAKGHLNTLFRDCLTVGKYASKNYKESGKFGTVDGYLESLKDYFAELDDADRKIKRAEQKLADLVPLGDREIIEAYKSTYEPDTAIIIVSGDEIGPAWDLDEFQKIKERENGKLELGIKEEEDKQ